MIRYHVKGSQSNTKFFTPRKQGVSDPITLPFHQCSNSLRPNRVCIMTSYPMAGSSVNVVACQPNTTLMEFLTAIQWKLLAIVKNLAVRTNKADIQGAWNGVYNFPSLSCYSTSSFPTLIVNSMLPTWLNSMLWVLFCLLANPKLQFALSHLWHMSWTVK